MRVVEFGEGRTRIAIVGSLHGNELLGKQVIEWLSREKNPGARIKGIVANEAAIKAGKRFVDVDGNRCFPGKRNGNAEERMAFNVMRALKGYRYVIDIHSTHADMQDTIIITKRRSLGLARKVPLGKLVMMGRSIAKGKAIDDFPRECVSLEFNKRASVGRVSRIVRAAIDNILRDRASGVRKDTYLVTGVLPMPGKPVRLRNYRLVRGRKSFYPIFFGETEYKNTLCMVAVKKKL